MFLSGTQLPEEWKPHMPILEGRPYPSHRFQCRLRSSRFLTIKLRTLLKGILLWHCACLFWLPSLTVPKDSVSRATWERNKKSPLTDVRR